MNCKECGVKLSHTTIKGYNKKYPRTGYCRACLPRHKRPYSKVYHIECPTCKTQFIGKTKRRRFCSQFCTQRFRTKTFQLPKPDNELLISKGKPKRGVIRNCGFCNKEIYILPCLIKRSEISFCSKEHHFEYQRKHSSAFNLPCSICAKPILVCPSTMKWRPRTTCGLTCRKVYVRQLAEKRRLTYTKHQLDRLARYSKETSEWRKDVFARDDYTCQMCGERGGYLEADHIKPWAYFPELRHDISNGRTLCRTCHDTTKIPASRMKELYDSGYWG